MVFQLKTKSQNLVLIERQHQSQNSVKNAKNMLINKSKDKKNKLDD